MTPLRTYEALYIVKPDIADDEIQTVANGVESLVTDNNGTIVRSEVWGKRRLAYEVNQYNEGCYVLLRFQADADFIKRLQGHFKLKEEIIRNLIVHFDDHMLRLEAEQARRQEEDARKAAAREQARRESGEDDDDDRPRRSFRRDRDEDED